MSGAQRKLNSIRAFSITLFPVNGGTIFFANFRNSHSRQVPEAEVVPARERDGSRDAFDREPGRRPQGEISLSRRLPRRCRNTNAGTYEKQEKRAFFATLHYECTNNCLAQSTNIKIVYSLSIACSSPDLSDGNNLSFELMRRHLDIRVKLNEKMSRECVHGSKITLGFDLRLTDNFIKSRELRVV